MSTNSDIRTMDRVLATLGVAPNTLTMTQREDLDTRGYAIFPNLIHPDWLDQRRDLFERICHEEGDRAGIEVSQVPGVRRLADLVNKSPAFDGVWLNPRVLAAARHLIARPFRLHSLNGHDPLPGHGAQELHCDTSETRRNTQQCHVVNSMWMLDHVSTENGATRAVPRSHRFPDKSADMIDDCIGPHPDETYLTGTASTVAVFHGHLWHSCTQNRSPRTRRIIHCAFVGRELPQQTNQRYYLREETAKRLSPAARFILDA